MYPPLLNVIIMSTTATAAPKEKSAPRDDKKEFAAKADAYAKKLYEKSKTGSYADKIADHYENLKKSGIYVSPDKQAEIRSSMDTIEEHELKLWKQSNIIWIEHTNLLSEEKKLALKSVVIDATAEEAEKIWTAELLLIKENKPYVDRRVPGAQYYEHFADRLEDNYNSNLKDNKHEVYLVYHVLNESAKNTNSTTVDSGAKSGDKEPSVEPVKARTEPAVSRTDDSKPAGTPAEPAEKAKAPEPAKAPVETRVETPAEPVPTEVPKASTEKDAKTPEKGAAQPAEPKTSGTETPTPANGEKSGTSSEKQTDNAATATPVRTEVPVADAQAPKSNAGASSTPERTENQTPETPPVSAPTNDSAPAATQTNGSGTESKPQTDSGTAKTESTPATNAEPGVQTQKVAPADSPTKEDSATSAASVGTDTPRPEATNTPKPPKGFSTSKSGEGGTTFVRESKARRVGRRVARALNLGGSESEEHTDTQESGTETPASAQTNVLRTDVKENLTPPPPPPTSFGDFNAKGIFTQGGPNDHVAKNTRGSRIIDKLGDILGVRIGSEEDDAERAVRGRQVADRLNELSRKDAEQRTGTAPEVATTTPEVENR